VYAAANRIPWSRGYDRDAPDTLDDLAYVDFQGARHAGLAPEHQALYRRPSRREDHGPDLKRSRQVDEQDRLIGIVDWNKLNGDVPDMELGYRVFDRSDCGKGIATEALDLLAGLLFDTEPINRLRLTIHVDNVGSRRVAEKCGFMKEGMAREAWYHRGRWHDIDVFTLTRAESDARRKDA
jgi:RimJ/RimL family protein N-acetyltransferase